MKRCAHGSARSFRPATAHAGQYPKTPVSAVRTPTPAIRYPTGIPLRPSSPQAIIIAPAKSRTQLSHPATFFLYSIATSRLCSVVSDDPRDLEAWKMRNGSRLRKNSLRPAGVKSRRSAGCVKRPAPGQRPSKRLRPHVRSASHSRLCRCLSPSSAKGRQHRKSLFFANDDHRN